MSYLELAKKIQAQKTQAKIAPSCPAPIDLVVDDSTVAVLIDSTVLGAPIWFAFKDGWQPDQADDAPVFYASELPALREKSAEQLRSIFNVKRAFRGGIVKR